MQPIIVPDVRISQAEYVALSTRMHQRQRWTTLGLTAALLTYLMWSDGSLYNPNQIFISAGILTLIIALASWLGRRRFRNQYVSIPSIQQAVTYTLTADGIATHSAIGQSTISWANILLVKPLDPWFIVTTSPGIHIPLDSRLVQAPHTAADLGSALTQRGANLDSLAVPAAMPVFSSDGPAISISHVCLTIGQYTWLSLRLTIKMMPIMWVVLLPIGSALLGLYQILSSDLSLTELWQENSGQLIITLFFLSSPLIMLWSIRKQYHSSPLLKHPANYLLTPDKMLVEYSGTSAEISWAGVQKVNRMGRWTFLQTTTNAGYILDMQQVAPPNTAADVFALFKDQHIVVK